MRRIHVTIAALVALALALGFGCMRGWRASQDGAPPSAVPAIPDGEKHIGTAKPGPAPSPFDALIDPSPDRLFADASRAIAAPEAAPPSPADRTAQAARTAPPAALAPGPAPLPEPVAATPSAPGSAPAAKREIASLKTPPVQPSGPLAKAVPPESVNNAPEKPESAAPMRPEPAASAPDAKIAKPALSQPPASSEPSTPPAPATPGVPARTPAPKRIMVAGDSFAVGVGLSLAQTLKGSGIALAQCGKTSSGLNSPRFYDWNAALTEFLAKEKPDALVVMLGANDAQNGSGSGAWIEDFSKKTGAFIEIAQKAGAPVYWVGLPPMRDEALNAKVKAANQAMKTACEGSGNCVFIESWDIFCDASGTYVRKKVLGGKTVSLRAKDGVHMTMSGYKALGDKILDKCAGKREISLKE